jgi:prepilin-type processing-associated H-X9-DG protein
VCHCSHSPRGISRLEIVAIVVVVATAVLLALPAIQRAQAARELARCAANMKGLGQVMKMYARENDGRFPPIAWHEGPATDCANPSFGPDDTVGPVQRFAYTMDFHKVYPDYLTDASLLVCPSDTDLSLKDLKNPVSGLVDVWYPCAAACRGWSLADNSYTYFGYVLDKAGRRTATADRLLAAHPFPNDVRLNYMADAIATWDQDHPDRRVSSLVGPPAEPIPELSVQLFAWQQVIGDTMYRGKPGALAYHLGRGLGVGPPRIEGVPARTTGAVDVNRVTDEPTTADIAADLDWSAVWLELGHPRRFPYSGTGDTYTIFPLRENVGRYLITDNPGPGGIPNYDARIPVLMESPKRTRSITHDEGSIVLFLDGHAEYLNPTSISGNAHHTSEETVWTMRILHYFLDHRANLPTGVPELDDQCR